MKTFDTWQAVPPQPFTADGTSTGLVTVATILGFYLNQKVTISATGLPDKYVQIKRFASNTSFVVGPVDTSTNYSSVSFYTVALGSTVAAATQTYPIDAPNGDILPVVYENLPIAALRVIPVDGTGTQISAANPFPVTFDGTIAIGDVSIVEGGNTMVVNPDGSINVDATVTIPPGTIPDKWSDIELTNDSNGNLVEVQYLLGATIEQTLTLTYDSNGNLTNVSAAD